MLEKNSLILEIFSIHVEKIQLDHRIHINKDLHVRCKAFKLKQVNVYMTLKAVKCFLDNPPNIKCQGKILIQLVKL